MSFASKRLIWIFLVVTLFPAVCVHGAWKWDGDVVTSVGSSRRLIALTFDDGPHPHYTMEILKILEQYNVKATFFPIGNNIKSHPEITKAVIDAGHEIGNHTMCHKYLTKCKNDDWKSEICSFDDLMLELFEYKPKILRPPGGLYNEEICKHSKSCGYSVILWSIDTRDWAHTPANEIAEKVCNNAKAGSIILMHDFIVGDSPTPNALRFFIPTLLEKGYEFVTISTLIGQK